MHQNYGISAKWIYEWSMFDIRYWLSAREACSDDLLAMPLWVSVKSLLAFERIWNIAARSVASFPDSFYVVSRQFRHAQHAGAHEKIVKIHQTGMPIVKSMVQQYCSHLCSAFEQRLSESSTRSGIVIWTEFRRWALPVLTERRSATSSSTSSRCKWIQCPSSFIAKRGFEHYYENEASRMLLFCLPVRIIARKHSDNALLLAISLRL